MNIEMQYGPTEADLSHNQWEIAFVGTPIDTRGERAIEYLNNNSSSQYSITYIPKDFQVKLGVDLFDKDDIEEKVRSIVIKSVVLDATTMSFAEILILTQALKNIGIVNISMLYIEPNDYSKKRKEYHILHKRDFDLSEEVFGYEAIPGHALSLTSEIDQKIVFLCGFEAERIDRAMEDSQAISKNCCCIFGVPAMSLGWEMDSFDNSLSVIKERKISGGVNFCGATNPLSVFQKLEMIYKGLETEGQLFVVPLATKPMSIGACLFLLSKPKDRVAALYDHPKEMKGRALEISNWHLFNIDLTSLDE